MNPGVGANDGVEGLDVEWQARVAGHRSSRFGYQQGASGHVPRAKITVPEPIEPSSRNVSEVHCGGSDPADSADLGEDCAHARCVFDGSCLAVIRESGGDQAVSEIALGDVQLLAVQEGSTTGSGREHLAGKDFLDDSHERRVALIEGDGHGHRRHPVQEVDRAIERVHDPLAAGDKDTPGFFGHDVVVGSMLGQQPENGAFGGFVGGGYGVYVAARFGIFELSSGNGADIGNGGGCCSGRRDGELKVGHRISLGAPRELQHGIQSSEMKSLALALVAAFAAWASFPPMELGFLVIVVVPLLLLSVISAPTSRLALASGLLFGVTFMSLLMSWLAALGIEAMIGLMMSQALWYPLWARVVWKFRDCTSATLVTIAVGGWTAMEFGRARLPAGGLNWGALGYPLGEWAAYRSLSQFVGATGLEVLLVLVGVSLLMAILRRDMRWVGVALGVVVLAVGVGGFSNNAPDGEEVRVAIVQGNSPCPRTHCPNERQLIFESHLRLTSEIEAGRVDLVLWAESASTFPAIESDAQAQLVAAEARRIGATLVVGGDRGGTPTTFINSNVIFSPEGRIVGEYLKNHPVPFGEYVPLRPIFGLIPVTDQVPRDMVRGDGPVVVDTPFGKIGSVISFEGAFARYGRSSVEAGAGLLLVASNESSYGDSPAAAQFIGMTRMRAAENGVDVVHGAVTGSSVIITNGGELGPESALFEEAVVTGEVNMRTGPSTLYTRWGDWVAVVAIVAGAYVFMVETMEGLTPSRRSTEV